TAQNSWRAYFYFSGYGGLSVSVQGPSKAELTCKEVKAGLIKVNYKPTEPGVYVVAVKFADNHVKDSPFTVQCTGKGAGRKLEEIHKKVEQAGLSIPNKEALMFLKLPNVSPMDSGAKILDPKGRTEDVEMRDLGDQFFQIRFHPKMEGVHHLSVLHKDAHIYGSPFQFTVGPFSEGGAHKVKASGLGVVRGETNYPQSFNIYTREAGPGKLSVSFEGPSKAEMAFHDHKVIMKQSAYESYGTFLAYHKPIFQDGTCSVTWVPPVPGEYKVHVKLGGKEVHDSPFTVLVAGEGQKRAHLSVGSTSEVALNITQSELKGISASIKSPSGIEEPCFVRLIEGGRLGVSFTPREAGEHLISVKRDGKLLPKAPFKIKAAFDHITDVLEIIGQIFLILG
ncbi:Filamin/ABP280 repeat protein, partial [Ancylostoma caninum]